MTFKHSPSLFVFLLASLLAASLGGYLTSFSVGDWYKTLEKPSWNPPNWIFGPVWTTLYAMMAVAAWLVWQKKEEKSIGSAMISYGVQLVLNTTWSGMFFALENPLLGLVNIVLLWIAILWTLDRFRRVDSGAAVMMAPYFLWVTFALTLNFTIWRLNS